MNDKYFIINKKILPDTYEKVLRCSDLIENEGYSVTDACIEVDLSRSAYYKYKDNVFSYNERKDDRRAVISLQLKHKQGSLIEVLKVLLEYNCNILTINQNIPVNNRANVIICMDLESINTEIEVILDKLKDLSSISSVKLISIE